MRRAIVALAGLSAVACSQLHSQDEALLEALLAPGRQVAERAAEPDAEIVFEIYDPARDRVAASECKAVYAVYFTSAFLAPMTPAEQRRLQIHGRVNYHRIEALAGKPEGENDERMVDMYAYLRRHNYELSGLSTEEKGATLIRIEPSVVMCDKALAAWGAPQIDEKSDRDYVARYWENFGARVAPSTK